MITKKAETRITETLNFLHDTPLLPSSTRHYVEQYLADYLTAAYPVKNNNAAYKTFSDDASMANVANAGNSDQRMLRRALVLMWKVMGSDLRANQVKAMAVGDLNAHLRHTVLKALICSGMRTGDTHAARYVLDQVFRRDPLQFLTDNPIMISGSTANSGANQNIVPFQFGYDPSKDRYVFSPANPPKTGHYPISPASIPAMNWWDVPGRGNVLANGSFAQIHGTKLSGSDIMLTTQFTGCSFCMKTHGGMHYAAHISPASVLSAHAAFKTDGLTLANQLCGTVVNVVGGNFANAAGPGLFRVYGRDRGNGPFPNGYPFTASHLVYCCIIGFEENGAWQLYCQHVEADGQFFKVPSVVNIFP
jgi:hypothetical protein